MDEIPKIWAREVLRIDEIYDFLAENAAWVALDVAFAMSNSCDSIFVHMSYLSTMRWYYMSFPNKGC